MVNREIEKQESRKLDYRKRKELEDRKSEN